MTRIRPGSNRVADGSLKGHCDPKDASLGVRAGKGKTEVAVH